MHVEQKILFEASEKKALNRDRRNIWIFFFSFESIRFIDLFFFLFSKELKGLCMSILFEASF